MTWADPVVVRGELVDWWCASCGALNEGVAPVGAVACAATEGCAGGFDFDYYTPPPAAPGELDWTNLTADELAAAIAAATVDCGGCGPSHEEFHAALEGIDPAAPLQLVPLDPQG